VAGFVIFTPLPVFARGGYLRAIAVAPDRRRKSIGRKLLSFAERETARHAGHLYLCVSSFNRQAQAFYRKCGYRKVGAVPGLIKPGISEHIYWKRLRKQSSRPKRTMI
jgi:ribosomal protein S18 acetylase RimI-like enzyme